MDRWPVCVWTNRRSMLSRATDSNEPEVRAVRASQFMTADVVTAKPGARITDVVALLIQRRITALPVVDDEGQLVGIVAEVDLLRGRVVADPRRHLLPAPANNDPLPDTVAEVMSRDVLALPDSADEAEFARLMLQRSLKSIPVVRDGRLVGIVARRDLLRTLTRDDEAIRWELTTRLGEVDPRSERWQVDVQDGAVNVRGTRDEDEHRMAEILARTIPGVVRVTVVSALGPASAAGPIDHTGLRVLGLDECLERLRSAPVGRIALVSDGGPTILPVNHGVLGSDVVFRSAWGSKLFSARRRAPVAFEADGYETAHRHGWSVVVRGTAEPVYDDAAIAELETLGVLPWADAVERPVWIRIRALEISGREIRR